MRYEDDEFDPSLWNEMRWKVVHKSNPPLRWIANIFDRPARYFLNLSLNYQDANKKNRAAIFSYFASILFTPYMKWGTFYKYVRKDDYRL